MSYFFKKIDDPSLPFVVFLHGWGQNKALMIPLANLCYEFANVVVLDLPGHGEAVLDRAYGISDYVAYLNDFLVRENIEPSLIVGHSFGGKIATYYTIQKKVPLLLLAPSTIKAKYSLKRQMKIRIYKILKWMHKRRLIKTIPPRFSGSTDYKNTSGFLRETFLRIVNCYPQKEIKKIKTCIYTVWGEDDQIIRLYQMKKMMRYVSNGQLIKVNGDHFAYLTNRKSIAKLIREILKECPKC